MFLLVLLNLHIYCSLQRKLDFVVFARLQRLGLVLVGGDEVKLALDAIDLLILVVH